MRLPLALTVAASIAMWGASPARASEPAAPQVAPQVAPQTAPQVAPQTAPSRSPSLEPDPRMDRAIQEYFEGELREWSVFMGIGAGTAYIGASLAGRGDYGVGAASAIIPVSVLQMGAGIFLWVRTPKQMRQLRAIHERSPLEFRQQELPRMERVNLQFDVLKGVEVALMTLGVASVAFGVADHRDGFVGAGLGLAAQAGVVLTFDLMAEERAQIYTEQIRRLTPPLQPIVGPTAIGLRGSF